MGNSRAFKRKITGAGEIARMGKKTEAKKWRSINRPHGSPRVKACPTHGQHDQKWSSDIMAWVNAEDWAEEGALASSLVKLSELEDEME